MKVTVLISFHLNGHSLRFIYRLKSWNYLVQHKTVPRERTAQKLSFKWSHDRVLFAERTATATLSLTCGLTGVEGFNSQKGQRSLVSLVVSLKAQFKLV